MSAPLQCNKVLFTTLTDMLGVTEESGLIKQRNHEPLNLNLVIKFH